MKNAIYTSIYLGGGKDYKSLESWHIENLYYMNKYCKKNNIRLNILDGSNKYMQGLYNNVSIIGNINNLNWYVGTLSSYVSVLDFIESDYDNMIWIDIDMSLAAYNGNIFEELSAPSHMKIIDADLNNLKPFLQRQYDFIKSLGLEVTNLHNSSMFKFSKSEAIRFVSFIKEKNIDVLNFKDLYKMLKSFEKINSFISDQCLYDAYFQSYPCQDINIYTGYYPKVTNKTTKIIHFPGENKRFIEVFNDLF